MKKLAILFTGLSLLLGTLTFAHTGDPVTATKKTKSTKSLKAKKDYAAIEFNSVKKVFDTRFDKATHLRWKITDEFYFVYFVADNHSMFAAFNKDAELLATSRSISKADLPMNITETLKRDYSDCAISETVLEMSMQGETIYYLSAENKERINQLKCFSSGDVDVVKKTKKKKLVGSIG